MKTKFILIIPLLMALLQWSCGEEAEEMPDWDITLTPVNEAYSGETATVEVKVSKAVEIQLLVDGSLVQSTLGGSLVYDVSSLSVGNHTVKVSIDDGYGVYEKSFSCRIVAKSVMDNTNDKPNDNNNPNDNKPEVLSYDYVDLGLPSGTLWATSNVGAKNPWDYGDYFAWGEVTTKEEYSYDTYTFRDKPTTLDASHDAAAVNMGSDWRMPTKDECQELISYCEWEWTDNYNGTGISGQIVRSRSNSNSIFLPTAGFIRGSALCWADSYGLYWSSNVSYLTFHSVFGDIVIFDNGDVGQPVRAVQCEKAEPAKVEIEMSMPSSIMIDGEKQMVYCKVNRNCSILFYIDDNQAATEIPGTSSGFYWQLPAYHPGTHILTARAFIDGVVVAEKSLTYTVEAKPQPQTYDYVDLGLPSGTLWATCNVGAENPWDYGDYFAWGETKPKEWYNYGSYTYHDTPSTLDALHDAATANWGRDWQTPSMEAWNELKNNCEWEWISDYNDMGVAGFIVASKINSNSIFIPAAGYREDYDFVAKGSYGNYWSSTLYADNPTYGARDMCFFSKMVGAEIMHGRDRGLSVRPVRCR